MSGTESKHVQTELTEDEYETFREIANERGMTVEEWERCLLHPRREPIRAPDVIDDRASSDTSS